jgi:hypothetical protein
VGGLDGCCFQCDLPPYNHLVSGDCKGRERGRTLSSRSEMTLTRSSDELRTRMTFSISLRRGSSSVTFVSYAL